MFAKSFDCIKLFIHGCILTAIFYFMKVRTNVVFTSLPLLPQPPRQCLVPTCQFSTLKS